MATSRRPAPSRLRRFVVEALEPRLLYSADLGPSLLGAALVSPVAEQRLLESEPQAVQPQAAAAQTQAREVVFVDAATPDADRLIADIAAQRGRTIDVVRIGADEDGLARISAELAARKDISAVHIISHGSDGAFRLGASTVDSETVQARGSELAGWSASLTTDADLLIYGCDVAQGGAGQALVEQLAALTGADVAASTNLTSTAALGGDLTLEFRSGAVEAKNVLIDASALGWQGLLAVTADTSSSASSATPVTSLTFSHTVSASGSDRFLLVTVGTVDGAQSVTSVTYGGTALTQIGGITENADKVRVELWYLEAPAAGTADVVVNIAGATSMSAGATTFFGVDQTTPYSVAAFAEGGGGAVDVTIASAAGELVVDGVVGQAVSSFSTGADQTELWSERVGNTPKDPWNASSTEAGAASVTMSWTKTGSGVGHWASGVLSLKAAAPITAVNVAPSGASNTVTTVEDSAFVFSAGDFGFSDIDGNALAAVKISSLPTTGTLTNNGVAVTAGQLISASDLAAGFLRFTPTAGASGTPYASFAFQVQDDGGTANGGSDLDPVARTMTVNVNAVNNAPVLTGANNLGGIVEDSAANGGTLVSDLIAGHVSDADAGASTGIAIVGVDNTNGTWQYSLDAGASWSSFGTPSAASARLLAADASTYVRFVPDAGWNGTVANGLTLRAWDRSSGVSGGTADTTSATLTVRDNFAAVSYANNDGTASWSTSWADPDGNPAAGAVQVTGGELVLSTLVGTTSVYRQVDLSAASGASLSFSYDNQLGLLGSVSLQVSSNGGATYSTLENFSSLANPGSGTYTADLSAYLAFNTRVRFVMNGTLLGGSFHVDNVEIAYTTPLSGGTTAFSASSASSSITVAAVNDAPSGVSNTVTTLEDTAYVFAAADFGFSDADGNALAAVRIATLPGAGTLTNNGVAISAGQMVSAADIAAGLLRFTPAPDANGVGYASFTFQVQDDGGTASGGVDLDPTARTMTLNVTAVNDPPLGKNASVTTLEDTAYAFTASDFGFSDADGNALLEVRLVSLPSAGVLTNNGVAVSAGQTIAAADVWAGLLRFTPAANASGAAYASFRFQVRDDGGSANGGADVSPGAHTMTVNVTAVNDAPSGANGTVTTSEDAAYVFATADFGFGDVDGGALTAVRFASLPASGTLTNNGVAVAAGQTVTAADIAAGLLRFTPASNANGAGYASFAFQVQDNGGTANGGADLDPIARTMTINVTAVNDAPSGANNAVTMLEDGAYVFAAADFGFSDTEANAFTAVRITSLPASGALTNNGVAVSAGQIVSAADIASGLLRFAPAANASGAGYASFTFQVQDDGGTANGGVDLDPTARTMTVNVTAVNDAPAGTDNTVTTLEDTAYVLAAADFGFSDADGNALLAVRIASLPASGTLTNNGVAVTAGQTVTAADIASGLLRFTPASNANGAGYASFTFQVQDDGGTSNGGVDLDAAAHTITVNVTALNDAPSGANNTVTTLEDTAYVFTAGDFGFSDTDGNALAAVRIASLPSSGTLTSNGVAVTVGQSVSAADIASGLLRFTPAANANGTGYAAFGFQVQDDGGTASGGANLDPIARTMTVNVTSVNDAPSGVNGVVTMLEDGAYVFRAADFGFSDADGNALVGVRIASLPASGTLTNNGVAVASGQMVSAADIASGLLRFTPAANANGNGYASFNFQVQDDGGTANGGVNLDPTARTMSVNVTAVNDAPSGANNTVILQQDGAYVFSAADFGFSDSDGDALAGVVIGNLPPGGVITANGVPVGAGQTVSASDIAAGLVRYTPAVGASGLPYASFTFRVQDSGGTANGGANTDALARTMTIDVVPALAAGPGTNPVPPAPVKTQVPPDPAAAAPTEQTPALTAQTPPAAASARLLLASNDVLGTRVDVDEGFRVPVVAPPPATVFATAQRLANERGPSAGLPAGGTATEERQLESSFFGSATGSERAGGGSRAAGLAGDLDRMRDELSEQAELEHWASGSIAVGGFGLTVGYVLWLLRGGALLASLLSSLPAWRLIDPLPVLSRVDDEEDRDEDDDVFVSFAEANPPFPVATEKT